MQQSRYELTPEYKQELVRALRRQPTPAEARLWEMVRGRKLAGLKFRRQHPVGRYIADFCCQEARLIVELDGTSHDAAERRETDAERDAYLRARGYTVLRFRNEAIFTNTRATLQQIARVAEANQSTPSPSP